MVLPLRVGTRLIGALTLVASCTGSHFSGAGLDAASQLALRAGIALENVQLYAELPEQQARIFGKFERAVSNRHYGGFGLGLWIARQILESHGGRIELTSAPGAGATFIVRLPLRNST